MKRRSILSSTVVLCFLLVACNWAGDKGTGAGSDNRDIVNSREDIKRATVQILAKGIFLDPETGQQSSGDWGGSGFIIDPSGIAVTNNHVVTGSALLQVYVAGKDEPVNATVLGVSECSDLAVIDIEDKGYPYFQWHKGDISAGMDVFTAGFPLNDPEFTLTHGIVSKAEAFGDTPWSSIDSVIEHDATINPGNSGGPLVDATKYKVAGINYLGNHETDQYFAISSSEASGIIKRLREGQHVDSIGINGEVLPEGEGGPAIFVVSVDSGSIADEAGVRPGDIIDELEGIELGTDGTMADYCDILRSHEPSDTLSIKVIRPETEELLAGQLNGRNLEVEASLASASGSASASASRSASASASGSASASASRSASAGADDSGYTTITDETETLRVELPTEWDDGVTGGWEEDGEDLGPGLSAAPDWDAYGNEFPDRAGMFFGASSSVAQEYTVDEWLDTHDHSDYCGNHKRYTYPYDDFEGKYDFYVDCGDAGSSILQLAVMPENQEFLVNVQIVMLSDADHDAGDNIIKTFEVVGDV